MTPPSQFLARAVAVALLMLAIPMTALADDKPNNDEPTIVLVHGAWAGPSSWDSVARRLRDEGFRTVTPTLGLTSLAADVASIDAVLNRIHGKKILVAHSYGAFRHFTRPEHPHAQQAAEAAEVAAAQIEEHFWQMHDWPFEHQHTLKPAALFHHPLEAGLDTLRFQTPEQPCSPRARQVLELWHRVPLPGMRASVPIESKPGLPAGGLSTPPGGSSPKTEAAMPLYDGLARTYQFFCDGARYATRRRRGRSSRSKPPSPFRLSNRSFTPMPNYSRP